MAAKLFPILLLLLPLTAGAQSFTSFFNGDTTDVERSPTPGIVLAGGGGDNDEAMRWMLERADGGDVVVIRASGGNGYNPYFFSQLNVDVNSVETIVFNNEDAAFDPYVIQQIQNAECLFIAGGDQYDYYRYWKDTPIQEAINYLINEKRVPVGGTSAGMAILSDWYYAPSGSSLTSLTALNNPFHPNYEILGHGDFLALPSFLDNTITDTHYEQRTRPGRHLGFMARIAQATGERSFGIAANEYTAVCIDEHGLARAFGDHPAFSTDFVYFLQTNCQDEFLPEIIAEGTPLTWDRNQGAVEVYAVPARPDGSGTLDLSNWQIGEGGDWQKWYVQAGQLTQVPNADSGCGGITDSREQDVAPSASFRLFPNPAQGQVHWEWPGVDRVERIVLRDFLGRSLRQLLPSGSAIDLQGLSAGVYLVELHAGDRVAVERLVVLGSQ